MYKSKGYISVMRVDYIDGETGRACTLLNATAIFNRGEELEVIYASGRSLRFPVQNLKTVLAR